MKEMTLREISFVVAEAFFGEDVEADKLQEIVFDALNFDIPLVRVADNRYSLELFHGPTLAFKDVGARFMARLLGYFNRQEKRQVNVLVATSGDTGSAVANGFLDVPGVKVFVLYPQGKVSEIQEKQFTTLGHNITALEVSGTFDDCQALVKSAFMDPELNEKLYLTSANSSTWPASCPRPSTTSMPMPSCAAWSSTPSRWCSACPAATSATSLPDS